MKVSTLECVELYGHDSVVIGSLDLKSRGTGLDPESTVHETAYTLRSEIGISFTCI